MLGDDQGVDGEDHRDVAVQLQHSSLQVHHRSPQWREVEVHVIVHSEELSSDRGAGHSMCKLAPAQGRSKSAPCHQAQPDVLTGRSVHARLRREAPADHEARSQAAMAAAECGVQLQNSLLEGASAGLQPEGRSREETSSRGGADQFSGPQGTREPTRG